MLGMSGVRVGNYFGVDFGWNVGGFDVCVIF